MATLRGISGIRKIDKVRNKDVREICGVKKSLERRMDETFRVVHECMADDRLIKNICRSVDEATWRRDN